MDPLRKNLEAIIGKAAQVALQAAKYTYRRSTHATNRVM